MVLETQSQIGKIGPEMTGIPVLSDNGQSIDDAIERLTLWAEEEFGNDELVVAREEFFAKFGKVFHDDAFFGSRMSYFLNFYLFERPIKSSGSRAISPVRFYLDTNPERTTAVAIQAIHELSLCMHGVFQVLKVKDEEGIFLNLLNNEKIPMKLPKTYRLFGLKKNQVLQGFIFRTNTGYHPAAGIAYHPDGTLRLIKKLIKMTPKTPEPDHLAILGRLAATQLKATRMKHVDPKTIYKMALV